MGCKRRSRRVRRKPRSRRARQPEFSPLVDTTVKAVTDMVAITATLGIGTLTISKLAEMTKK